MTQSPAQGATALRHRPRLTRLTAQLTCLVALSALSTGCSLLPFGKSRSAKMARAMRPEVHEVKPNAQSECLAEDAAPTAPGMAAAEVPACATCACAATASAAKTRGGGWAKPATAAAASPVAAATARGAELAAGPAERQLQRLMDGNKRFVEGEADHDLWTRALTRGEISTVARRRPTPVAVVITRADGDSVAPDAVFDAMPGELLVIPAEGDIADEAVVQTVRDAVQLYEIPLVVVLGRRPTALPTVDSAARQASLKIGREPGGRVAQGAPLTAADRLAASDASLGARVAASRLKIVAANCEESNGQVSLELVTASVPEQVVQLSQD